MADEELDGELEDVGEEPVPDDEPAQPGAARKAFDAFSSQARQSPTVRSVLRSPRATGAVTKGVTQAGAALGEQTAARLAIAGFLPEIIAGLLALLAIGIAFFAIFGAIAAFSCLNGTCAGDVKLDPAKSQADSLELQTVKCLQEAAKSNGGDGSNDKLSADCIKPIQGWGKELVAKATAIKAKISDKDKGGPEAIKILDKLVEDGNKAVDITAGMALKQAREIADELSTQYKLATQNELIAKNLGFSANAQKLVDYIRQQGPAVCKQSDPTGCSRKVSAVLEAVFPGRDVRAGASLPITNQSGPPNAGELEDVKNALAAGNVPIWLIRGNGSGNHWIIPLNVDEANMITYFDPADGEIHTDPSDRSSVHSWYFGTPTKFVGNRPERGYIFVP